MARPLWHRVPTEPVTHPKALQVRARSALELVAEGGCCDYGQGRLLAVVLYSVRGADRSAAHPSVTAGHGDQRMLLAKKKHGILVRMVPRAPLLATLQPSGARRHTSHCGQSCLMSQRRSIDLRHSYTLAPVVGNRASSCRGSKAVWLGAHPKSRILVWHGSCPCGQ